MDEALRRLEREGEPLALATALRRAGRVVLARRLVEEGTRLGRPGARELLDAWHPLESPVIDALRRALAAGREGPALDADGEPAGAPEVDGEWLLAVTAWLAGDEDPRLEADLARLAVAFDAHVPAGLYQFEQVLELARAPHAERRRRVIERGGDRLPVLVLARARLDEAEVETLLRRARAEPRRRTQLLTALWLAGQAGGPRAALRELALGDDPVVAAEAVAALARSSDDAGAARPASPAALSAGAPARPAWVHDGCPLALRDPLTGALARRPPFFDDLEPSFVEALASPCWILAVEVDGLERLRDRHGWGIAESVRAGGAAVLQRLVGDRVMDELPPDGWLVWLEPDEDGPAVAARLRAELAAAAVAFSDEGASIRIDVATGVGRGGSASGALAAALQALASTRRARDDAG